MKKKMIDVEIDLVRSEEFRAFARKQTVLSMDDLDYVLYYLKLKDIEVKKRGDNFVMWEFINDLRRMMRE